MAFPKDGEAEDADVRRINPEREEEEIAAPRKGWVSGRVQGMWHRVPALNGAG